MMVREYGFLRALVSSKWHQVEAGTLEQGRTSSGKGGFRWLAVLVQNSRTKL